MNSKAYIVKENNNNAPSFTYHLYPSYFSSLAVFYKLFMEKGKVEYQKFLHVWTKCSN